MTTPLPTHKKVRPVMDLILAEATETGRRATVTAVEQSLGISHATFFYRSYRDLIIEFQTTLKQTGAESNSDRGTVAVDRERDVVQRLRQENSDLRRLVAIYEEAIRQLTATNHELRACLHDAAKVATLPTKKEPR